jgi:hypothetical protein
MSRDGVTEAFVSLTPAYKTRSGWSRAADDITFVGYRGSGPVGPAYRKAKEELRARGFDGCIERHAAPGGWAEPNPSREARRKAVDLARREHSPKEDARRFNTWANHEAEEAKLLLETAQCCRGKRKREKAEDEAIEHAAMILVSAADTGLPISRAAYYNIKLVKEEVGDRFPQLGLRVRQGANVSVSHVADNPKKRRSGPGSYPWEECMADAFRRYGDEETARRVCGSIRAKSRAKYPGYWAARDAYDKAKRNPGRLFPVGRQPEGPGFTKAGKPKLVEIDYERGQHWGEHAFGPQSSVIVSDGLELLSGAGLSDDLTVYLWGNEYLVLGINRPLEYATLSVFTLDGGKVGGIMVDETNMPDVLGERGLDLKESTIVKRMVEGLPY